MNPLNTTYNKTVYAWVLFLPLLLIGCSAQPVDNRTKLAQTEVAATAAFRQVTTLVESGIIKKGSPTAVAIADAELVVAGAIRVWRTNPDDPKLAAMALNALPGLLQLIANAKSQRAALVRNYLWARSPSSSQTCLPSSRPLALAQTCWVPTRLAPPPMIA